jgi:hypothetical protein
MLPDSTFAYLIDLARWRAGALQEAFTSFCPCSLTASGTCSRKRTTARRRRSRRSRTARGRSAEPSSSDGPSSPSIAVSPRPPPCPVIDHARPKFIRQRFEP